MTNKFLGILRAIRCVFLAATSIVALAYCIVGLQYSGLYDSNTMSIDFEKRVQVNVGGISGVLVDRYGAPVGGMAVYFLHDDGGFSGITDSEGRFVCRPTTSEVRRIEVHGSYPHPTRVSHGILAGILQFRRFDIRHVASVRITLK